MWLFVVGCCLLFVVCCAVAVVVDAMFAVIADVGVGVVVRCSSASSDVVVGCSLCAVVVV